VVADPLARRRSEQVAHSLNVVAELPDYVEGTEFPIGLRVAAVDAFFVHLRLLIEFLIKRPDRRHPAIHRDDYASSFNLAAVDSVLYGRMDDGFEFASRHVAHFSLERLRTEDSAGVNYVSVASLRDRADDVFAAMAAFVRHMRSTESPYADDFGQWLSAAKARRPKPPTPGEPPDLGGPARWHRTLLSSLLQRLRGREGGAGGTPAGAIEHRPQVP
jgi:hypothetical protein